MVEANNPEMLLAIIFGYFCITLVLGLRHLGSNKEKPYCLYKNFIAWHNKNVLTRFGEYEEEKCDPFSSFIQPS